ncbi:MAG: nucleotidyltransferase domain-containing protein [Candidatus Omnitrophota bacterium]|jgi:predicted nucleotidyltransferase
MLSRNKIIEILKKEFPRLKAEFSVKKIGIFGSYATGAAGKASDVDIFIDFTKPIGLKFMDLAEHLEKILGKKVDILTPAGIKGIRIKQISQSIKKSLIYV